MTAPLRICPLGAHVDHQGGVVTGMTVDRHVTLVAQPAGDSVVRAVSLEFPGEVGFDISHDRRDRSGDWGDYLRGAARALAHDYPIRRGARLVVTGDLPGSGLSSSAAVLVAYLFALAKVNDLELSRQQTADLVQKAENSYVGVASGQLDQSIILYSNRGSLTRVDCSDLSIDHVPCSHAASVFDVLVAFSGIGRELAGSGFNQRVAECREAARLLLHLGGRTAGDDSVLSDVHVDDFARFAGDIPPALRRRATHFFEEQQRVLDGLDAWRGGDLARFGELMTASGASSITNYECGTDELITLYNLLRKEQGVLGTRFSGGGFGGSCIALIEKDAAGSIIDRVGGRYREAHPEAAGRASFHVCGPDDSARVVKLEE